jgi:hypothetical protein
MNGFVLLSLHGERPNFMSSMKTKFHFLAVLAVIALACPATAQVVFDQDFDDTGVFNPSLANGSYAGTDTTTSGRWGAFLTTGGQQYTISTDEAYSGTQSLKMARTSFTGTGIVVRRNGTSFADPIGTGASSQKQFSLQMYIYRLDDGSNDPGAYTMNFGSTTNNFNLTGAVAVLANGQLGYYNGSIYASLGTLASVGVNDWTEVRWDFDLDAGVNGQVSGFIDGVAVGSAPGNLSSGFHSASDRVNIAVSSPDGNTTYVDNFQLIPEPSSFALVGLGALALLARRRRHSN